MIMAALNKTSSVIFYYDIVCPFAYMASRLVERVCQRAGATVQWRPVLLGGLYELTQASQGKGGSATDVMAPAKLRMSGQDLFRQMVRTGAPYKEPDVHPKKTVTAMRLLAAIPDNSLRASVSHSLYRAYWSENRDVTDLKVLEEVVTPHGVDASQLLSSEVASQTLRANTTEASERGAFGVPGFYVGGKFYFGTDRMFFVERALGMVDAEPERLVAAPTVNRGAAKLTFYFDYSSPWSFIGYMRLERMLASVAPVSVNVEWVPILLGALFKQIGTPMVPAAAMNEVKRRYYQKDLFDWVDFAGIKLQWPDSFPLRSVLPLRVTLASGCDPKVIDTIYKAAWQQNKDIGNEEVLLQVLNSIEGAQKFLEQATNAQVKSHLHANTSRAVERGLCGVPTFQVNDGVPIWGQDKMNIVADMICGWQDPGYAQAKL